MKQLLKKIMNFLAQHSMYFSPNQVEQAQDFDFYHTYL